MKKSFIVFLLLLYVLGFATAQDQDSVSEDPAEALAWIIPVQGDIEPSIAAFLRRETRKALAEGAAYLVFEIDTFGGRVDTALQISSFIGSIKDAKTIAWVRSGPESMGVSWSAGALIALSCSEIYMASGTSIGAAAPVTIGADGQSQATGEKTVSAVRSQMAAIAEKNAHPTAIALAMVDQDIELWEVSVNGELRLATLTELERMEKENPDQVERISMIDSSEKLLSLTAGESVKYGLAAGMIDDLESMLAVLGAAEVSESLPSAADHIVALLTSAPVQTLLILLGLVMLFLEINSPGFGIPGSVAIIAFVVVFGSSAMLGNVGSLEMVLFLVGVALLAVEIFILPGFGVAGISGIVLIGFSLIFSMQDFVIPSLPWQWELLGRNVMVVGIGLVLAISAIAAIALSGPKLHIFDRLTLKTSIAGTASGPATDEELDVQTDLHAMLVGKKGEAVSPLRLSGQAKIEDSYYSVESNGAFIEKGAQIEVIRVSGNRIIVRSVS